MSNVLITGANRGIGLEICRQLQTRGETVYAVCRQPGNELASLGVNVIDGIDVTDQSSVSGLANALDGIDLDLLVSNAGVLQMDNFDNLDFEQIGHQFEVNAMGPLRLVDALRNNLVRGSRVGIVTSRVGSIEDNGSGNNYGYRMSKVAANMAGKNLSHDLAGRGIPVMLLHPGLVATEMTRGNGIAPATAASGLINQLDQLTMEKTGTFWHAEGYQLPW